MFEARLSQGILFKKVVESIKDLVLEANFDVTSTGISLQAMDTSHVSMLVLLLHSDGFKPFRCDRTVTLGLNVTSLAKVIKCLGNDDMLTIKAEDGTDTISFMFENEKQEKISEYEMKLMDIDATAYHLHTDPYTAIIKMPSTEFQRIVRDLAVLGEAMTISVTKEGVKFSTEGELASGNITIRQKQAVDVKEEDQITIDLDEPVSLTFAIQYFQHFTKATSLNSHVTLSMSPGVPMCIEYNIGEMGYIRFFFAPKLDDDEDGGEGEEGEEGEAEEEEAGDE